MIKQTNMLFEYGAPGSNVGRNVALGAGGALAVGTQTGRAALSGAANLGQIGAGRAGKYVADQTPISHINPATGKQDYIVNNSAPVSPVSPVAASPTQSSPASPPNQLPPTASTTQPPPDDKLPAVKIGQDGNSGGWFGGLVNGANQAANTFRTAIGNR